jgi:hypothetical protein
MTPNSSAPRGPGWLSPLIHLSNNWISLAGVIVVTTATVFWLFLLPTTLKGDVENPYIGILAFLTIPVPFFGGLALIPLGIWRKRRREGRSGALPSIGPLSWENRELRRLVYFVGVKCHIGPGAGWFVKSKLSGLGQVVAVTFNTYPRPIPTPVHNLRPARDTCEACHWPQKYGEDRVRVINKFGEDEQNTQSKTVLLMKIGGGNHGIGIHGTHLGPGVRINYIASDEQRQNIPWVEYNGPGRKTVYTSADYKANAAASQREMDCMDCHNRPSHSYDLPERGVDKAMNNGLISPALPFAKKKAVEILKVNYTSRDEAAQKIPAAFARYYQDTYPAIWQQRQAEITASAKQVLEVWNRNIFPEMKVTWGAYPVNIGHTDYPGCFRCHDDAHKAADGKAISQDCNACHNLLATDEVAPKILTELGVVEAKH